jgi:hypothetical protein
VGVFILGRNIYKKKVSLQIETPFFIKALFTYFLCLGSEDTESFLRPFDRRAAITF